MRLSAVMCLLFVSVAFGDEPRPPGWQPVAPGSITKDVLPPGHIDTPAKTKASREANPVPQDALADLITRSDVSSYEVRCPDDAVITINGAATQQTGSSRLFRTHPDWVGVSGTYTFKASLCRNGQCQEVEKTVNFIPGERKVIDFTSVEWRPSPGGYFQPSFLSGTCSTCR